jgi:hypothetical protein
VASYTWTRTSLINLNEHAFCALMKVIQAKGDPHIVEVEIFDELFADKLVFAGNRIIDSHVS